LKRSVAADADYGIDDYAGTGRKQQDVGVDSDITMPWPCFLHLSAMAQGLASRALGASLARRAVVVVDGFMMLAAKFRRAVYGASR